MPRNTPNPDPAFEFTAEYEDEIIALEEETEHKVSQTMSAIESAVAAWEAAGKKPPSLRTKILRLQRFYDALIKWEKKSLLKKKEKNLDVRIKRLKEFVEICARYEKSNQERAA
jgi:hypothetical protein